MSGEIKQSVLKTNLDSQYSFQLLQTYANARRDKLDFLNCPAIFIMIAFV